MTTSFSKTTCDATSAFNSTSRINVLQQWRTIYAETCSKTVREDTISDTSVNISEQQSENNAS